MNSRCLPSRLMHRAAIACMHAAFSMFASRAVPAAAHIVVAGHSAATASVVPGVAEQEINTSTTSTCGRLAGQRLAWVPQPQPGHPAGRRGFATRFRRLPVSAQPSDIFIAEAHKLGPFPLSVGQVRLRKVPREVAQQQEKHSSRPRVAQ
jgi:hypothetical protein